MVYIDNRLYDRASFFFFFYFLMYVSVYHHFLFVILFLLPICIYRTTKHQLGRYIVLYIDGKNAYDSVCRIILKRYKPVRAQWVLSFAVCVGEKKTKREEKKTRDNTKKRERERQRYMYIYKPSASLILVRRAQKATRQICVASPCVCVLKRFYSGK